MGHSPDQAHAGANVHRARGQLMETCGSARRGGQRRRARSGAGAANLLLIDRHRRPAASPVLVAATLLLRPPRGVAAGAAVERDAAHRDVLPVRAVPRLEEASAARTAFGHGTQLIWHQARYISQAEALPTQRGREIGFSRQWRPTQKQRATVLGAGGAPDATGLNPSRRRLRPGPRPARRQIFSPIPRARPPPRRLRERRFDTLQPRAAAPRHTASRAASRCSDRARGSARHGACELSHVFALAAPRICL